MKKMIKKAVTSTTAVKVEDKVATKNIKDDKKIKKVAKESIPVHITKDDLEWNDYIVGLKKNVEDSIKNGLFNFHIAWIGFIDDDLLGYVNAYDYDKLMRTLVTNGYCYECARNFIDEFVKETNENGKKMNYVVISRDECEFCDMQEEYELRLDSANVDHMK